MMNLSQLYIGIVITVALLRILEILWSKKNERNLKELGGFEVKGKHFLLMKAVHTLWLFSCLTEFIINDQSPNPLAFYLFGSIVLLGMFLRYLAIATLGNRWTVTIWILPEVPAVRSGVYKWIRHPNYLGVILELFALPLMGSCFITAALFTILNAIVLKIRIRSEEFELARFSKYDETFKKQSRFIPRVI